MIQIKTGGMLTAEEIRLQMREGRIAIEGFVPTRLNANSYNLTLGSKLLRYKQFPLDPHKNNPTEEVIIPETGLVVNPGDFYLGVTNEWTETEDFVPCLSGRSSVGRLSVAIHQTAGFGDIGYKGNWTLEIFTIVPTILYPKMEICQIYYFHPYGEIKERYGEDGRAKYQNARVAQGSYLFKELESGI